MVSNVYTKNEILQSLASKGYFIDTYTLDTFFEKWRIEAIFEDEQGSEFYDKSAMDLVLKNLFSLKNTSEEDKQNTQKEEIKNENLNETKTSPNQEIENNNQPEETEKNKLENISQEEIQPIKQEKLEINDDATLNILNKIKLSDGTPIIEKINKDEQFNPDLIKPQQIEAPKTDIPLIQEEPLPDSRPGILEGAMQAVKNDNLIEYNNSDNNQNQQPETQEQDNDDFDDISLLSESLEAQEKFRQYVVSELVKKNVDLNPKNNEFKLDISERTLNMIARTMAKKIAKHVNAIFSADAKNATQLENVKEENKKLTQRAKELEEQNRKLRLLLTESNKNLNSYKPSIFGLYKKVNPSK